MTIEKKLYDALCLTGARIPDAENEVEIAELRLTGVDIQLPERLQNPPKPWEQTGNCTEQCPHLADAQRYHWLKKQSVANRMLIATIAWRYDETTKYSHDQLDEIIDTAIRIEEDHDGDIS